MDIFRLKRIEKQPTVLIKNDCRLVAGNYLLQTFDYLEVAEFSAMSLVMCVLFLKEGVVVVCGSNFAFA